MFTQYAQDLYVDIPMDVPVDRPAEGVMKVKGKGKQLKVKVNTHEVINKEWHALLIQANDMDISDLSNNVVVIPKCKADDDVNPKK